MEDAKVIEAMIYYGGSFAKALGQAARLADPDNLFRIKFAFPDMWDRYAALARLREANHDEEIAKFYDARDKGGECGD